MAERKYPAGLLFDDGNKLCTVFGLPKTVKVMLTSYGTERVAIYFLDEDKADKAFIVPDQGLGVETISSGSAFAAAHKILGNGNVATVYRAEITDLTQVDFQLQE